jgi:hypothetical protein
VSDTFTFSDQVQADLDEPLNESGNKSNSYFNLLNTTGDSDDYFAFENLDHYDDSEEEESDDDEDGEECGGKCKHKCKKCKCKKYDCKCPHLCDVKICKPEENNCCVKTEFKDDLCVCGSSQETIADQSDSNVTAINSCGLDCASQKSCGHGCINKTFIIHGGISVKEYIDKDICDGVRTCADGRYYKKAETLNRTCSDCDCDPIECSCNGEESAPEDGTTIALNTAKKSC